MSNLFSQYLKWMSIAGFFVLGVLSGMAFVNMEFLRIKEGKNVNSGIILLIVALVYGIIAIYLIYRENKFENRKLSLENSEVRSMHNIQGNDLIG